MQSVGDTEASKRSQKRVADNESGKNHFTRNQEASERCLKIQEMGYII